MQNRGALFAVAGLFVMILLLPVGTKATLSSAFWADEPAKTFQSDDPGFFAAKKLVEDYVDKYWKQSYIRCGTEDRWFSFEITEDPKKEPRYFEVKRLRIITTIPYRPNTADKYNKEWTASSVTKGEAYRWCKQSASSCGKYAGDDFVVSDLGVGIDVFSVMVKPNSALFSKAILERLNIKIEKGKINADDPMKDQYAPKCADVMKHPIWKEI